MQSQCKNPKYFSAVSSYVYLGAHNLYDTETGRKIIYTTTFIAHPDYDQDSIANDVSLVRLPAGSLTSYSGNTMGKLDRIQQFSH